MKIVCDFCKTEYALDNFPAAPVRCAICGNTWVVQRTRRKNSWMLFLASICALLSALIFSFVLISRHQIAQHQAAHPLTASVTSVDSVVDAAGIPHFVVHGTVVNHSTEIYGVPDLIILSLDDAGRTIAQQKFMPSATLLDAGQQVEFTHTLSTPTAGVKQIKAALGALDTGDEQ